MQYVSSSFLSFLPPLFPSISVKIKKSNVGFQWNIHETCFTPREQFFWRTAEQDSLSLSSFLPLSSLSLPFSLPSFIPILVYLPSVTDRVRCQAELKSFHRVQMVLIFMPLPLLVSREISVQFILMRVLKSDWTDGERFALTKLCRLLNGDSYF